MKMHMIALNFFIFRLKLQVNNYDVKMDVFILVSVTQLLK